MDSTEWLGMAAGLCTTVAFAPQAWKIFRSRQVADVSLGMYVIFVTGTALWLAYGLLSDSVPIIVANGVTLLLAGSVLAMKVSFRDR